MFVWIWQLENQVRKYGSIDGVISKLKSIGITDVCVKYHEGSSPIGGGLNYKNAFLKYKDNFKSAGFRVGTWGYNYFNHVQDEANMIIEALHNSDYYIFDPEVDTSHKNAQAEQVCQIIRSACPNATIGYSSFPIVSYHTDIAYSAFNKYCDFASPQAYWQDMGWGINKAIDRMMADHRTYGLNKPIYPSIQSYKCNINSYNAYSKYGFANTGFWSFDEIDSVAEQYIRSVAGTQPSPSPNPSPIDNLAAKIEAGKKYVGDRCTELQSKLNKAMNYNLVCDGDFGSKTYGALISFQSKYNLTVDGLAGTATFAKLDEVIAGSSSQSYDFRTLQGYIGAVQDNIPGNETLSKCPTLKVGATGNVVRWMQGRLNALGFNCGGADGVFGNMTLSGIKRYQSVKGLSVDGVVGQNTWRKLLGL